MPTSLHESFTQVVDSQIEFQSKMKENISKKMRKMGIANTTRLVSEDDLLNDILRKKMANL